MSITIVTGCHRSGTSALAASIASIGWRWHNGRPMQADEFNPQGYFEDLDFVELHERSILRVAPASNGWRFFGGQLGFNEAELALARQLIAARADQPFWGFKDPRAAWFTDQWRNLIPDALILFTERDREATIASLVRRGQQRPPDAIDEETAGAMWDAYRVEALRQEQLLYCPA